MATGHETSAAKGTPPCAQPRGGGGRDVVDAGAGDDQVLSGPGNDVVNGGAGDDIVAG